MGKKRIILGITGASGMLYCLELLEILRHEEVEVHGIISRAGAQVLSLEQGMEPGELPGVHTWHDRRDFTAPAASGSSPYDAMVILPCTTGTLAAVAAGLSTNLIHRAADVTLKERRPLLLAVREMPFNRTHLTNMLALHDAGAVICPPVPAFYQHPKTLSAMARNYAGRLCDLLGIRVRDLPRWQGVDHA